MRLTFPRRGPYHGRLAFDPETGFHIDPKGRKVVTDDDGKTWRYARRNDMSHQARYHVRNVLVDATTNEGYLADDQAHAHHVETQPGDPHYQPDEPRKTRLVDDPDPVAATITSHTEAYA